MHLLSCFTMWHRVRQVVEWHILNQKLLVSYPVLNLVRLYHGNARLELFKQAIWHWKSCFMVKQNLRYCRWPAWSWYQRCYRIIMQQKGHGSGICSSAVTTSKGDEVFEHICRAATRKGALSSFALFYFSIVLILETFRFPALRIRLAGWSQFLLSYHLCHQGRLISSCKFPKNLRGMPMRWLASKNDWMDFNAISGQSLWRSDPPKYCFDSWSACRRSFGMWKWPRLREFSSSTMTHVVLCLTDRDNYYLFIPQ